MAEQAFALTYDCFSKYEDDEGTEQIQRYQRADPLYQSAIEIGNGVVDAEARMTWSFFKAFNHQQICGQYILLTDGKEMLTKHLGESIASYKEVLRQEPTPLYKAQTLVNLKCVLARSRTNCYVQHSGMLPIISRFEQQVATLLAGEGSVSQVIALVKSDHRVLNTMACALKCENIEEAEATVSASLETESDPKINWYAYHLRGQLTLDKYIRNTKAFPHSQGDPDNIKLLDKSISDFKSCQEGMHLSKSYYLLGKATMKLAEANSAPVTSCSSNIMIQALAYFNKALELDQGQRDRKIHGLRAECLKCLKEDRQAVESWKRAVELDRQSTTYRGNIKPLLIMLLDQCRKMSESKSFQPTVAETATYLKLALSKYDTVYDKFIPALIERFPEQFLHAANYFTITNDLATARRMLDYVDQTITWPLSQEIAERRRRIEEDIEECREALANAGVQKPRSSNHEQTADSDQSEEGTTGGEELEQRLPATEEQKAFIPLALAKARNTKGFKYDFFVIHSAKDEEWVNYTLLAYLEGEHHLKGCIAERDFKLGEYVLDNITLAIKESAKVLVILTPDMVQSKWCKHEMKDALHAKVEEETETVIPVLQKDCEVPDEIKNIIYLDALENFDWEHLLRDIQSDGEKIENC
ncbi:uncharacterized protein LOC144928917 [Branchiostoma floridae x Branchiostoma belcheri]